ncbi:MAG: SpoIIE family protein phosphatase [Bacteroidales bacterium]|nr:SpoIIE family protein phosphatase [Bacteroidales bacterium]
MNQALLYIILIFNMLTTGFGNLAQPVEGGVRVSGTLIAVFIIIGVVVLGLLAVLYLAFRKIKRINSRLEAQKDEIECQKNLILVKNEQITDSINYARKIQDSILVPEAKIKRWLPDMFIYYKPKDIVSGDFYWFSRFESKYVITAIDCTGHGVPGAFLSMIGNTLLHEIVNIKHVFKPDQILAMLHTGITLALNQNSEDYGSEGGMDMSLCTVDTKLNRFQFAGAKNSIYVVQGDKLKILKANYYSVGGKSLRPDMKVSFTCYDFMYDENTSIYMFSDGYLDQFGGESNEKFNAQRFKELILANRSLPMEEQKAVVTKTMEQWIGDRQQIDDFLVMGVKLSRIGKFEEDIVSPQPQNIIAE